MDVLYYIHFIIYEKAFYYSNIPTSKIFNDFCYCYLTILLLLLSTFFPYNKQSDLNAYQKVKALTGSYYYFILFLFLFIILNCMTAFFLVYSKALMEIEMIPPYILILITGIIGLILNLILLTFTSCFKCTMDNFIRNICITFSNEGSYYDNLLIYFSNMKSKYNNSLTKKEFFVEIFVVYPFYLIFSFLEFACQMFAVYYLNPNYILIKDPIYFGLLRLILLFYNIKNLSTYLYIY